MELEIGDKVIYPNHGLGVVERIEEKTILGTTYGFYSLRMAASETIVLVPVDNLAGVGVRRAIADSEVNKLFLHIGNGKIDNHQNWKGRFKDNSDKMRTGSIRDVIDVLKSLNFLSQSKNLSFREKRMLDRAKFLVVSEIAEVTGEMTEVIEKKVEKTLERCLVNRIKRMAKAKVSKTSKVKKVPTRTILKSLNFLSQSKNLSFREKRMLDRAKFLVVSEIAEVTGEMTEVIEKKVEKTLERCLVNRIKRMAKAKVSKTSKVKKVPTRTTSRRAAKAS